MGRYISKRLLQLIPTLWIISVIVFILLQLSPGDPAAALEDNPNISSEDRARYEASLGLNDPIHIKYLKWSRNILSGDLGISIASKRPVAQVILDRLPNTLILMLIAQLTTLILALPVGIISAVRQYSIFDHITTTIAFWGHSIPIFWFGLLLILIFSLTLKNSEGGPLLPAGGMYDLRLYDADTAPLSNRLKHLILPIFMLTMFRAGRYTRYMRSSMLDVLHQDYLDTARAKGRREWAVILIHALKNAAIPVITILALDLPNIFSGAIFTETIFSWPGMGRLFVQSVERSDYDLVMGIIMINAFLILLFNLFADIIYAFFDPRVRYE